MEVLESRRGSTPLAACQPTPRARQECRPSHTMAAGGGTAAGPSQKGVQGTLRNSAARPRRASAYRKENARKLAASCWCPAWQSRPCLSATPPPLPPLLTAPSPISPVCVLCWLSIGKGEEARARRRAGVTCKKACRRGKLRVFVPRRSSCLMLAHARSRMATETGAQPTVVRP